MATELTNFLGVKVSELPADPSFDTSRLGLSTDPATGKLYKVTIEQWITLLTGLGVAYAGAADTDTDPGTPDNPVYYTASTAGTYTNFLDSTSTAIVITEDEVFAILSFDGTAWSKQVISFPQPENKIEDWAAGTYSTGDQVNHNGELWVAKVDATSTDEPSSDSTVWGKVTDYVPKSNFLDTVIGKNKFNKNTVIIGQFINTSGILASTANGITSDWMDVDDTKTYYLSGTMDGTSWRFKDASGTLMKPIKSDGTEYSNYAPGSVIGIKYIPSGAVAVQITVQLTSSTGADLDTIQFEEGEVATTYEAYSETDVYKSDLMPSDILKTGNISDYLEPYAKTDDIIYHLNMFNSEDVIEGYYVDNTTGVLVSYATCAVSPQIPVDDTKTYYLSGRNTGSVTSMRFIKEDGTLLKPVDSSGTQISYGSAPLNGVIYVPSGAVAVQFTVKFVGTGTYDEIQFEEGDTETDYKPYSDTKIKPDLLPDIPEPEAKKFTVVKSGDNTYFRTSFNDTYDIVMTMTVNTTTNSSLNISAAKLIGKTDDTVSVAGKALVGGSSDDACPTNLNNGYISGNHGNSGAINITATAHGKTLADVGSSYTDSEDVTFYLLGVVDANTLLMISENVSSTPTYNWSFKTNPSGTLTYVAGASHTTDITISSVAATQLWPSTKDVSLKLIADGVEITEDGTYTADEVSYFESYNIVDTVDMVTKLVSNRPSSGYTTQPTFQDGDTLLSRFNTYNIQDKCSVTLLWSWIARKDFYLLYFGGTQDAFAAPSWATAVKRYFPSSLPVSDGTTTFDFRTPIDIKSTSWAAAMNFTPTYWENDVPPSRVVDLMQSSGLNVNFNLGFIPVGIAGTNRPDNVSNAWYLYTSKKLYPYALDGTKLNASGHINAGLSKQGICFRGWSDVTTDRTNLFIIRNGADAYIFIDWHEAKNDLVPMPDDLLGKTITVVEKSDNVTINNSLITGSLDVDIATATVMYGYCILKIS